MRRRLDRLNRRQTTLIQQLPLLTRDVRRYRMYFPDVTLIAPEA